jgi:hypothetical protein
MNRIKFVRGVAMLCVTSILWVSCQKQNLPVDQGTDKVNNTSSRLSGVAPDDPALVAKVPILASADFLASKITNYFSYQPQTVNARSSGGRDRTSPNVNITNPLTGSTVSNTVSVQVSASDNVGVTSVVLKVDGNTIGTSSTAPYNFSWNTTGLSSGTHTLTATASDAAGNSSINTIQVGYNTPPGSDITPPAVNITSPVNGASVTSTITISASATDNIGVSAVNFQVDGTTIGTDNSSPYSISWNSSTVPAGIHTLNAIATDAAGNATSYAIQVTVNTTIVDPPPTLPSSVQLLMPQVRDQGGEGSCVAFAVGYAARSCEKYYSSGAGTYSESTNILSPEYLFNKTKTDAYCSSSSLIWVLEFLKTNGICTWQSMPYSSSNGCSTMPTAAQTTEAANFRISSYSQISTADITAIKTQLFNKHPLLITFTTDSYFSNATPGFIWSSYSSTLYAGHAVTICGYDDSKHAVKIINSWGTGWGENGYTWIDYGFLPSLNPSVYSMNL